MPTRARLVRCIKPITRAAPTLRLPIEKRIRLNTGVGLSSPSASHARRKEIYARHSAVAGYNAWRKTLIPLKKLECKLPRQEPKAPNFTLPSEAGADAFSQRRQTPRRPRFVSGSGGP